MPTADWHHVTSFGIEAEKKGIFNVDRQGRQLPQRVNEEQVNENEWGSDG